MEGADRFGKMAKREEEGRNGVEPCPPLFMRVAESADDFASVWSKETREAKLWLKERERERGLEPSLADQARGRRRGGGNSESEERRSKEEAVRDATER